MEQGRNLVHNHSWVLHSREQSLEPRQETRAQDRDQERRRLHRSNLHHAILLHHRSLLLCGSIEQMMVQQTTPEALLQQ